MNDSPLERTTKGWLYGRFAGSHEEIGVQHGRAFGPRIAQLVERMKAYTFWATGIEWETLREAVHKLWWANIPKAYQEEITGIANGVNESAGAELIVPDLFFWNCYLEVLYYFVPTHGKRLLNPAAALGKATPPESCTAFIATGSITQDGRIVMAHNTFAGYEIASMNLLLDITTAGGHRFVMQTFPGLLYSGTDFAVTSNGLMITESTLGGFQNYCPDFDKLGRLVPAFARARMAMEQAADFDDFQQILRDGNTGGYANAWFVGDHRSDRIMRYELGYEYDAATILDDGCLVGFNAPIDPRIRNLECANTGYMDIRRHQGARQVRLGQLVAEHKGAINTDVARAMLADRNDPYLSQMQREPVDSHSARNVDARYELDSRTYMSQVGRPLPFQPQGAVDGKVTDSKLAASLDFHARWGSSSGLGFEVDSFLQQHPQFEDLRPYLEDREGHPWTTLSEVAMSPTP